MEGVTVSAALTVDSHSDQPIQKGQGNPRILRNRAHFR